MMERHNKISEAVCLLEHYYCLAHGIKNYIHGIYGYDLRKLRHSLIELFSGDSREELVDFSEAELDDFIEFIKARI